MTRSKNIIFATIAAFMLACCTASPPESAVPDLTFAQVLPVPINAGRIEILNDYISPEREPNVEHLFKTTPATAAKNLIQHEVVPAPGGLYNHILRAHIVDASVVKRQLPIQKGGVDSLLSRQPDVTYDGRVTLRFEMVDENAPDIVLGHADVTATRSKTLLENASLADHDRAYFDLTEAMMNDLAQTIAGMVGGTFGVR